MSILLVYKRNGNWLMTFCDYWMLKEKLHVEFPYENYGFVQEMSLVPATKEQRDLLFQKIKEAGYEWDAEKKELKIEQKSAENKELTEFDKAVGVSIGTWTPKTPEQIQSVKAVSKKLLKLAEKQINDEHKQEWSEEDEKMLNDAIDACKAQYGNMSYTADWLLSIKDRVQPQQRQEWNEEDEKTVHLVCEFIRHHSNHIDSIGGIDCSTLIERLKSLRPQPQKEWKPSDAQMEVLQWCKPLWTEPKSKAVLESLINDLKKLREE